MKKFYHQIFRKLNKYYDNETAKNMSAILTSLFHKIWSFGAIPETSKMVRTIESCQCDFHIVSRCFDEVYLMHALSPFVKSDNLFNN